jgi:hypothetical protein
MDPDGEKTIWEQPNRNINDVPVLLITAKDGRQYIRPLTVYWPEIHRLLTDNLAIGDSYKWQAAHDLAQNILGEVIASEDDAAEGLTEVSPVVFSAPPAEIGILDLPISAWYQKTLLGVLLPVPFNPEGIDFSTAE